MITSIQATAKYLSAPQFNINLNNRHTLLYGVDLQLIESILNCWIPFYQYSTIDQLNQPTVYKTVVSIDNERLANNIVISDKQSIIPHNYDSDLDRLFINNCLTIANIINSPDHLAYFNFDDSQAFVDNWLDTIREYYQISYTKSAGSIVDFRNTSIDYNGRCTIGITITNDGKPVYTNIVPSLENELSRIALLAFILTYTKWYECFVVVPSKLIDHVDGRIKHKFVCDLITNNTAGYCQSVVCTNDTSMLNTHVYDNYDIAIIKHNNNCYTTATLADQTKRCIRPGNNMTNLYLGSAFG